MREVELKAAVENPAGVRAALERAGARLVFAGRLEDRRWDTRTRTLAARDHVLRTRRYRGEDDVRAELNWKGPTASADGYKVREELGAAIADVETVSAILERLGYEVSRAIDRDIEQFELAGATVRIERYPRMDVLVEVEGPPEAIERAIAACGVARAAFTAERLPVFVERFERRTGERAALCDAELDGVSRYAPEDAG